MPENIEQLEYSKQMENALNTFYNNSDVQQEFEKIKKQFQEKDVHGLKSSLQTLEWMKANCLETSLMSGIIGGLLTGGILIFKPCDNPITNMAFNAAVCGVITVCAALTSKYLCMATEVENASKELTYSLKM